MATAGFLLTLVGCDSEKTSRLEKQVEELKANANKLHTTEEYDLQAKCSRDAKTWFSQTYNGVGDAKDTNLLEYSNHYNKSGNKCFVFVEYHFQHNEEGKGS